MITDLPADSIIKMRSRGRDELWRVVDGEQGDKGYTGVHRHLVKGDTIHQVTWKGDTLQVKRTYVLKEDMDWVPAVDPPPPDTTEESFNQPDPILQMLGLMASAPQAIMELAMKQFVLKGHTVIIVGDGGTSVTGPGFSWSWMTDKRNPKTGLFEPIGPTAAEMKTWVFADYQAYAQKTVDEYHKQGGTVIPCWVCHPPFHNVERPKKAKSHV